MRKLLLVIALCAAVGVLAAACTGSSSSSPTPTPASGWSLSISAAPHAGNPALARLKTAAGSTVCGTTTLDGSGNGTITAPIVASSNFTIVELFLRLQGATMTYTTGAGDGHAYSGASAVSGSNITMTFVHGAPGTGTVNGNAYTYNGPTNSGPGALTWKPGTGCPGN